MAIEEHKTWVKGGVSGGGHLTPYKLTMKRIKDYLKTATDVRSHISVEDDHPLKWVTVKEILDHCETHEVDG